MIINGNSGTNTIQLQFICPDCHRSWVINVDDEQIIHIMKYDDICACGNQCDPIDIIELVTT